MERIETYTEIAHRLLQMYDVEKNHHNKATLREEAEKIGYDLHNRCFVKCPRVEGH